jgi:hypothetical protein
MLLLGEIVAASNEGEEGILVIDNRAVTLQLNEFTQRVAPERRPEALVDERDELLPQRLTMIALTDVVPLGCFTCHIECGEEHFTGRRRLLDAEELIAPIQPLKWISSAIKGGEEQLVTVLGGLHCAVVVVPWQRRAATGGVDLVGL